MNLKEIILLIILLIAPATALVMIILLLTDDSDCLEDINKQASECENNSSYPNCDVNAYCSKYDYECGYDVNKAVKGLCPKEYQDRVTQRRTIAGIALGITVIEIVAVTRLDLLILGS